MDVIHILQRIFQLCARIPQVLQGCLHLLYGPIHLLHNAAQTIQSIRQVLHRLGDLIGAAAVDDQVQQLVHRRSDFGDGLIQSGVRLLQLLQRLLEALCRVIPVLSGSLQIIPDLLQIIQQVVQQIHGLHCLIHNGGELIQRPGYPGGQLVDLVNIAVGPVGHGIRQLSGDLLGLSGPLGQLVQLSGHLVRDFLPVVSRAVHQVL